MFEPAFGEAPSLAYSLLLVLHLLGILLWAGGLLHGAALKRGQAAPVLAQAAHPGAALAILTGLILAFQGGWLARGWWLYAKIFLVLTLIPITLFLRRTAESTSDPGDRPVADFGFRVGLVLILAAILLLSFHKFL